jgi:hypothetical protein
MEGWIKLHRKIILKGFYKKSQYLHLWIHLLLSANHKENEFLWNGKNIIIKEGQLLIGRKQLSIDTGIPQSTIEKILRFLETEHQIEQQKTTKFRIITIVNWKKYQKEDYEEHHLEQQRDNSVTTKEQQRDTNNNDKNDNNVNKILKEFPVLNNSDFLEAWKEWETYRKEIKHSLTNTTRKKQLTFLSKHPVQTAIDMINQSIEKGWQGLFEINNGTKPENRSSERNNLSGTTDKKYKTADI